MDMFPFTNEGYELVVSFPHDIEIICIDDGSTDASYDTVVNEYSHHQNLSIYRQENKGASSARNNGFRYANGDYVWFFDADDYIYKNALTGLMPLLNGTADILTVAFSEDVSCELPSKLTIVDNNRVIPSGYTSGNIIKRCLIDQNHITFHPGISYGEDTLFGIEVGLYAHHSVRIEQPLFFYRYSAGSVMGKLKLRENQIKRFIDVVEANRRFIRIYYNAKKIDPYLKIDLMDKMLTYNLIILGSDFVSEYSHLLDRTVYPLPLTVRLRYLRWDYNLTRVQSLKIALCPRSFLKQVIKQKDKKNT